MQKTQQGASQTFLDLEYIPEIFKNTFNTFAKVCQARGRDNRGSEQPAHLSLRPRSPLTTLFSPSVLDQPVHRLVKAVPAARASPVHDSRDSLPRPKARHALQLFIGDPGGNDDFLGVTTAEPGVQRVECKRYAAVPHFPDTTHANKQQDVFSLICRIYRLNSSTATWGFFSTNLCHQLENKTQYKNSF